MRRRGIDTLLPTLIEHPLPGINVPGCFVLLSRTGRLLSYLSATWLTGMATTTLSLHDLYQVIA